MPSSSSLNPCYWHNPRGTSWASAHGINVGSSCCPSASSTASGWVSVVNQGAFPCTTCVDNAFAGCHDNWGDCTEQNTNNSLTYIGNYEAMQGWNSNWGGCLTLVRAYNSSASKWVYGNSSETDFWYYNLRGTYADEAEWASDTSNGGHYKRTTDNACVCWNGMTYTLAGNHMSDGDTNISNYTFTNNLFDNMTLYDGCEGCCACNGWSRLEYPTFPYKPWAAHTCCTGSLQPLQASSSKTCCQNGTELWIWAGGNTLPLANAAVDKLAHNILHRGFIYTGLSSSGNYTPNCSWQGPSSSSGGGSSPLISGGAEWESLLAVPPSSSNPDQDYAFTFLPLHHRTSRPGAPTIQGGRQLCTNCGTQRGTVRRNTFGTWCGRMIAAGGIPRVRIVGREICPRRTTVSPPPTRPTTPTPKEWCHKVWRQLCLNDSSKSGCGVSANPIPSYPCVSSPQSVTWPTNLPLSACKAWQGEGKVTCETGITGIDLQFAPPGFTAQYVYGPWGQNEIRFRFQWLLPLYGKFNPILYVQDKCSKTIAHYFPFDVNCSSWSLTSSLAGHSVHPSACICSWSSMNFMPFLPLSSSSQGGGGTNNSSSSGGGGGGGGGTGAAASEKGHYFAEYNCKDINTLAPDVVCDVGKRQFLTANRHVVVRQKNLPKNGGNTCFYDPAFTFHFVINHNNSSCNLYINEPKPCVSQTPLDFSNKIALDHCCECDSQSCSPYVPANSSLLAPKPSVDLRPGRYCFHQEFYTWPVISAPTKKNTQAMNESTTCEPADNCGATYKHPHPGPEIVSIRVPRLFTEAEVKGKWIALDPKHGSEKYKFYNIIRPVYAHLSSAGNPSWGPSSSSSRRRTSASVTPSPSFWPPPPPCFLAGTKIAMADGTEKNIEDVVVGDTVKAFDIDSGEVINSLVPTIFVHPNTKGYYIINNDIKVTGNHPMRVGNEWKDVDSLKVGDKLHRLDGSEVNIETIDKIEDTVTTYNFEVENVHNYFANKYLAHNKTPLPAQGSSASLQRARWKCKDCGTGNDLYIAKNPWNLSASAPTWEMGLTIGKKYLTCEYPAGITCMQGTSCAPVSPPCMPTGPLGYLQVFHPLTMYAIQAPNYPLNLNGQQGVIGNNCEWLGVDGQGNGLGPFTNIMGGYVQDENAMCAGYGAYDPRGTNRYAHCCTPTYSSRAYKACCDEVGACGYELAKWENNRIVPAGVWGCHQMTYCQCKDYGALPTIWGTYYQGQGTTCGAGIALADTLPSKCSSSEVQSGNDIIGEDCQNGYTYPLNANGFTVSVGSTVMINTAPYRCVTITTLNGVGAPVADIIHAYNDCVVCVQALGNYPILAQQSSAGGSP